VLYVGVIVCVVWYYYVKGLLFEFVCDYLGYWCYDVVVVVELVKICILVDVGVLLLWVCELLVVGDEEFVMVIVDIDYWLCLEIWVL